MIDVLLVDLDDPARGPEFSVRTMNVLKTHGCKTMRDVADKLEHIKKHAKGFGARSYREVKEMIQYYERQQPSLLDDPEYVTHLREDKLTTIVALMQDVHSVLLRMALQQRVSVDTRRQVVFKLKAAMDAAEALPVRGE